MAKKSIIERELKRTRLVQKYAKKAADIKQQLQECYAALTKDAADHDEVYQQIDVLQSKLNTDIPRNATKKRLRNRCRLTGRSRGVYRKFQLSRSMLRQLAMMGMVPGVRKSSW